MKFLVHLSVVVALFLASIGQNEAALTEQEMRDTILSLRAACGSMFTVTDEQIANLNNRYYPDNETDDLKCYVNCILETFGIMKKNTMNYNLAAKRIKTFMPPELQEKYLNALTVCRDAGANLTNPCEKSYIMLACYQRNNDHFFIP